MATLQEIQQHFTYNKETGVFTRISRKNSNGSFDKDGYLILKIKGKQYKAHRIAWLFIYGEMPKNTIDHINRNRTDNRIKNLRDVTQQEQILNTTKIINPDTGVIGIYLDKVTKGLKSRYTFRKDNKVYRFRTLQEAINKKYI